MKQRLIDVDEFIKQLFRDADYVIDNNLENLKVELPKFCPPNATTIAIEMIKKAKTVDAIPIEWLEKKYKDLEYSYSFGATDELKSRMDGIRYAINLWRKENE